MIQLVGASGLPTARLAHSDTTTAVGDQVESVGNSYGRGYPSIGVGPVISLGRTITSPALPGHRMNGLIAAGNHIEPGQSGGPMINTVGEVIAVNDAYQQISTTDTTPSGIGFAIPIATALHVAHSLLTHYNHTQLQIRT